MRMLAKRGARATNPAAFRMALVKSGLRMLYYIHLDLIERSVGRQFPPLGIIGAILRRTLPSKIGSWEDAKALANSVTPLIDTGELAQSLAPQWNGPGHRRVGTTYVEVGSSKHGAGYHTHGRPATVQPNRMFEAVMRNVNPSFFPALFAAYPHMRRMTATSIAIKRRPIIFKGQLNRGGRREIIVAEFIAHIHALLLSGAGA